LTSFPVSVRGRSSTKSTRRGALNEAIRDRTYETISSASSGPGVAPAAGCTKAVTTSPISGSGSPSTATSWIAGCRASTFSISCG